MMLLSSFFTFVIGISFTILFFLDKRGFFCKKFFCGFIGSNFGSNFCNACENATVVNCLRFCKE